MLIVLKLTLSKLLRLRTWLLRHHKRVGRRGAVRVGGGIGRTDAEPR